MFIVISLAAFAVQLIAYKLVSTYLRNRTHVKARRIHVLHSARNGYPEQVALARNTLGDN